MVFSSHIFIFYFLPLSLLLSGPSAATTIVGCQSVEEVELVAHVARNLKPMDEAERKIAGMLKKIEHNGEESVSRFELQQACIHRSAWWIYDLYQDLVKMKESGEIE